MNTTSKLVCHFVLIYKPADGFPKRHYCRLSARDTPEDHSSDILDRITLVLFHKDQLQGHICTNYISPIASIQNKIVHEENGTMTHIPSTLYIVNEI